MTKFKMYEKFNTVNVMGNDFTVDYLGFEYANLGLGLDYTEEAKKSNIISKQFLSGFYIKS